MIILVQTEIMLAQRLQAKPEPHEDPLLCGRLLQQEAAIFSQSPSTPPGCDVGYGEREFQRQLSASRLLLCFFWSCVSKFNGTLYSHCPCRTSKTLQYREIFWQNGSLLYGSDTAKQEFFMRLQLRLQSLHKHDFISNQLLFYCWLTQQHFNFSVSFSFNNVTFNWKCYTFMFKGNVQQWVRVRFSDVQIWRFNSKTRQSRNNLFKYKFHKGGFKKFKFSNAWNINYINI